MSLKIVQLFVTPVRGGPWGLVLNIVFEVKIYQGGPNFLQGCIYYILHDFYVIYIPLLSSEFSSFIGLAYNTDVNKRKRCGYTPS